MSNVLATIGATTITDADVDAFIETLSPDQKRYASNPQFRGYCLDQLIAVHCFAKLGEELNLEETEEFHTLLESAKKTILSQVAMNSVLSKITVSDEECKAHYETNSYLYQKEESVLAKHILVAEEEQCKEIQGKILSGEMDFDSAAKEFSTCPSSSRGGSLGKFGRGQMVAEFDQAAFAAEVGQIVGPIKTQFGYHLILVEEKTEAGVAPYEEVAEQIKSDLLQEKQNNAYTETVAELRAKYVQ